MHFQEASLHPPGQCARGMGRRPVCFLFRCHAGFPLGFTGFSDLFGLRVLGLERLWGLGFRVKVLGGVTWAS